MKEGLPPGREDFIKPIFIFSLPRSGSTFLQRLLAAHPDIATVSEPWLLLPFLYTLKESGSYTEYSHRSMARAVVDFCRELPGGRADYLQEMRRFVLRLYRRAARSDQKYFVDKTPRYYFIVDEIIETFPEGKYIFLWRNPLAVVSSMVKTTGRGRWNIYSWKTDLYAGIDLLTGSFARHRDRSLSVCYEDLVRNPELCSKRIFEYLELPFDPAVTERFADTSLKGRMGDSTGSREYDRISREPLDKWKYSLSGVARKAWCRRYLRWIGPERLATMGYSEQQLLSDINSVTSSARTLISDVVMTVAEVAIAWLEPLIIKNKLKKLPGHHRIHMHR